MADDKKKEGDGQSHFSAFFLIALALILFLIYTFLPSGGGQALLGYLPGGQVDAGGAVGWLAHIWFDFFWPMFIFFDVLLIIGLVLVWIKARKYHRAPKLFDTPMESLANGKKFSVDKQIRKIWFKVVERAQGGTQESWKSAILEGDAVVDLFLKKYGYEGDTMADRLSQIIEQEVSAVEQVWKAHRLRNDIAHTPGFGVSKKDTQDALTAYRDFLREVGVI
ncbi:MAG: hypothetical protein COU09_02140 [Candidatus Harrisonbacteria bacterium CG10_big_fil_rev_8_21_14_0_10_44_23]|uniref:DUF4145 domain-containing protein n=1 Tax=Candidatus Harrisonbacteria bacterium CG10_big_fil_rev_8_21_14_0_10_44_23 TaxID=1974585 RepID=A0A2H0UPY7_9BACT|nr:MAG: hypothetical protein COU09_02140 [Candidatus Harrisonbacteria bacterium CG10_big_fil_rev_8_21_14_0_10_44_23]